MATVLVTGGSGFLGSWCVDRLLREGHEVRTTVRDLAREARVRSQLPPGSGEGERLTVLATDLHGDEGWQEAVQGCDYVLHVASPFPPAQPKDPDELIVPAREGTLRVLGAALDAGVQRVVVTSSVAAISGAAQPGKQLTEEDWTDGSNSDLTPYTRSKAIAERAAWDLVGERGEAERLAVINPGAILGPAMSDDLSYSLEVIQRLLKGMPGVPRIGFSFVDVRDVADAHLRAMTTPEAGGERFIVADRFLWMAEVAAVLRDRLGDTAAKVPTRTVPNLLVRAMALVDPGIRSVVGQLGRKLEYSNAKAKDVLGWSPRPAEEMIADCAQSLVDLGLVEAK